MLRTETVFRATIARNTRAREETGKRGKTF